MSDSVWPRRRQPTRLPSLGFSRQEYWSGLPFPSLVHESEKWKWSRSVVSDSSPPHGLQPTRLLHPWDLLGKSTGVGCHCLLPTSSLCLGKFQQALWNAYLTSGAGEVENETALCSLELKVQEEATQHGTCWEKEGLRDVIVLKRGQRRWLFSEGQEGYH